MLFAQTGSLKRTRDSVPGKQLQPLQRVAKLCVEGIKDEQGWRSGRKRSTRTRRSADGLCLWFGANTPRNSKSAAGRAWGPAALSSAIHYASSMRLNSGSPRFNVRIGWTNALHTGPLSHLDHPPNLSVRMLIWRPRV